MSWTYDGFFFFFRFNRRCSFRVSGKPVILGYTGPLITRFEFVEVKTHDLGVAMAYIHVQEEYDLEVPVFAVYCSTPSPRHGDPV